MMSCSARRQTQDAYHYDGDEIILLIDYHHSDENQTAQHNKGNLHNHIRLQKKL